jgi:hypothetical protein
VERWDHAPGGHPSSRRFVAADTDPRLTWAARRAADKQIGDRAIHRQPRL